MRSTVLGPRNMTSSHRSVKTDVNQQSQPHTARVMREVCEGSYASFGLCLHSSTHSVPFKKPGAVKPFTTNYNCIIHYVCKRVEKQREDLDSCPVRGFGVITEEF